MFGQTQGELGVYRTDRRRVVGEQQVNARVQERCLDGVSGEVDHLSEASVGEDCFTHLAGVVGDWLCVLKSPISRIKGTVLSVKRWTMCLSIAWNTELFAEGAR